MTPPQTFHATRKSIAPPIPARWVESTRAHTDSLLISLGLCTFVLAVLVSGSDKLLHWFVLPVWMCGVLVGMDAYDWARGRMSLFDPVGIIGLLGLHFFFLAPLLHISWNYLMDAPVPPSDWRVAMGGMAALNFIGLLVYRACRDVFLRRAPSSQPVEWRLNKRRFLTLMPFMLLLTGALQLWVYARYGGFSGYIEAATAYQYPDRMAGMGVVFLFSETFPILLLMLFAVKAQDRRKWQSWQVLVCVMIAFLVLRILFGGLRGSRSAILFALLWASGILHFYVRPISRQAVLVGAAFMVMFMYIYGFYKAVGTESFKAIGDAEAREDIQESSGRDFQSVLLGDLSRSDIQAFIFDRLWSPRIVTQSDYELGWGRTYLGAAAFFVPESIWPNRPIAKVKEGTEIIFGMNTYNPGEVWSSKIYGLAGETMLNFGPLAVPLAFAFFGLIVSAVRRLLFTLKVGDTRLLIFPYLVTFCALILTADSDNLMVYLVQQGAVPFAVIVMGTLFMRERVLPSRAPRARDSAVTA